MLGYLAQFFSTDLITEASFCRELSIVSNHILTGEDSVSHNLDYWCHVWRHAYLKGHFSFIHWKNTVLLNTVSFECRKKIGISWTCSINLYKPGLFSTWTFVCPPMPIVPLYKTCWFFKEINVMHGHLAKTLQWIRYVSCQELDRSGAKKGQSNTYAKPHPSWIQTV